MKDALNWFEIPVRDLDAAQRFYEALLALDLRREKMAGQELAVFPHADEGVGGALIAAPGAAARGADGPVVYLDARPSLDAALARARELGAPVLMPRMDLPAGIGAIAQVGDLDGHRIGLHQPG